MGGGLTRHKRICVWKILGFMKEGSRGVDLFSRL